MCVSRTDRCPYVCQPHKSSSFSILTNIFIVHTLLLSLFYCCYRFLRVCLFPYVIQVGCELPAFQAPGLQVYTTMPTQCFDYSYFFKLHFILNLLPIIRLLRLGSEIGREQRFLWGKHTWKVMTSWLMALGFQSPCLGHLQGCTLGETPTRALPSTCLCLMPFGALGDLESLCVAHGSSRHKGYGENAVLETSGNR